MKEENRVFRAWGGENGERRTEEHGAGGMEHGAWRTMIND